MADKILAGKSRVEDYFPEYTQYTIPDDGKYRKNTVYSTARVAKLFRPQPPK